MLVLTNQIASINNKHIIRQLILRDACDIMCMVIMPLVWKIQVVAFSQSVDRPFSLFVVHHTHHCTADGECLHACAHVFGAYCCVLESLTHAVVVSLQAKIR